MKKQLVGLLMAVGVMTGSGSAMAADDGTLKYSHNLVYLKCQSASCNGIVTGWHSMKVYHKYIAGIPPHSEARLYWNQNEPADIAAGTSIAHTEGASCPDGSRMKAKWFLSNFKPTSAVATDCDGVEHFYSVHEFNF